MFKKAFTLAEILITIGIIGVVAAFTIPVLVNNIANKENITHLKKSYAVLANIVQRAQVDNEAFNYWYLVDNDSEKTTFAFNRYVKPYMNIIKSCADGIVIFDNDLKITELNEAALNLFGREEKELLGENLFELVVADS